MPNPYLILGAFLAALFLAVGGYRFGVSHTEGEVAKRDLESANQYAAAVTQAEDKARATERKSAELLAAVDSAYQTKLKETNDAAQKTIADLRAGRIRVRIPATAGQAGAGGVPQVAAGAGGCDGQGPGDVLSRLAEDVAGRLAKCDAVATQLEAAQAVIEADRK
jgi:hypothetical protein